MATIFVYGTLQHPALLQRLLGRVPTSRAATLVGWRAAPLDGRVYPGLVPDPGAVAAGQLVEVDDTELAVLDRFEGPFYDRVGVDVAGVTAQAWALRTDAGELVLEGSWDLDGFVAHHAAAFIGRSDAGRSHPRDWAAVDGQAADVSVRSDS